MKAQQSKKKRQASQNGRGFVLVLDGTPWLWKPGEGLRMLFDRPTVPAHPTRRELSCLRPL